MPPCLLGFGARRNPGAQTAQLTTEVQCIGNIEPIAAEAAVMLGPVGRAF